MELKASESGLAKKGTLRKSPRKIRQLLTGRQKYPQANAHPPLPQHQIRNLTLQQLLRKGKSGKGKRQTGPPRYPLSTQAPQRQKGNGTLSSENP